MRNRLTRFQKLVVATWASVVLLIFVGAIVRATGAGLGCPDWPTCWGCLIPPTSVDQVDFERLDLDRFRKKAARFGIRPEDISEETLREQFNPVHVWTEYFNRLTSLPVGLLSLLTAVVAGVLARRGEIPWWVWIASLLALAIVLANAWLGRMVVLSGLQPGIITLHMALAILLLGVLVYVGWRGTDEPSSLPLAGPALPRIRLLGLALLVLTIFEGLVGSQVREMTDDLAKIHTDAPRHTWTSELEQSWMYLVHRSFSWVILATALAFYGTARRAPRFSARWLEKAIFGLVLAQMILGFVLSHVGILAIAQVLHIGLSSLLVSALFLWNLMAFGNPRAPFPLPLLAEELPPVSVEPVAEPAG